MRACMDFAASEGNEYELADSCRDDQGAMRQADVHEDEGTCASRALTSVDEWIPSRFLVAASTCTVYTYDRVRTCVYVYGV